MYQIISDTTLLRLSDGAAVPVDPENGDYKAYLRWKSAGNTPQPKDPAKDKAEKSAKINRDRALAIASGVEYGGSTWDSDPAARENLMAVLMASAIGVPLPSPLVWRDSSNVNHEVTVDFLKGLAATMLAKAQAEYQKSWAEKDKLK